MEATKPRRQGTAVDVERFRLRRFLDLLAQHGELETHARPIKLSETAAILGGNPKAVLMPNVIGFEALPLVGNVGGTRQRLAYAFGVEVKEILAESVRRLRDVKPEIIEVSREEAPVQQVVLTGEEADLTRLPVNLQHGKDGGPYISAAMDFTIDEARGWTNVGVRRLMLRGRFEAGIDMTGPSDLRAIYMQRLARGEKLPVSMVVGTYPTDYIAATLRLPVDELGLIASLRGEALPVVKCVTNDIRVPADAELVIEGYLDTRGYAEPEGPYGEYLGYYGAVKTNPVFHVTAITRRADAVFQTMSISGRSLHLTDTAHLNAVRTETLIWRILENAVREPLAVYCPPGSGGIFDCRIALRQHNRGDARNAIAASMGSLANVKNVFVVDPDVDIFSDDQMEWALGTRFQPHRDMMVAGGFRTVPLDPSLEGARIGSKAGYDLTLPFGAADFELSVPETPTYVGPRFVSVRAALHEGPKFFEELMAALDSGDGREVLLGLEELRRTGELDRDTKDGRYQLQTPKQDR